MIKVFENELNSKSACMAVQMLRKAWNMPTKFCLLESLRIVIETNLLPNPVVRQYRAFSHQSDTFVLLNQEHGLFETGPDLQESNRSDAIERNLVPDVDKEKSFFYLI